MRIVAIPNAGAIGIVFDRKPHELPLNAWSNGRNIRFRNGFAEKFLGETASFGTPLHAPYNVSQTQYLDEKFWVYSGLNAVSAIDSTNTHGDITRVSGAYSATADRNWVHTNFQGLTVLNNQNDLPQVWVPPLSLSQPLIDLPNWPADTFAKSMRAYRQYLVALNITKPGDVYPRMVKWSHPAAALSVPSSWDENDETKDAGEYELADSDGYIIDGLPLRDVFIIYKQDAVWGMQYVGGSKVMRFTKIFDDIGILGPRCITEFFKGKHLVMTTDDIIIHDGQTKQSILDDKMRRAFYSLANPDTFGRAFVAIDYGFQEVWCCAPTETSEFANLAVVWNWKDNTLTLRDVPNAAGACNGTVPVPTSLTWDSDPDTWDSDATVWDDTLYNPLSRRIIFARPDAENLILADDSLTFEGTPMECFIERTGLGVPFHTERPPDISSMKQMNGLWPRIEGTTGGVVSVQVGSQMEVNGAVTWEPAQDFTIGTDTFIPAITVGRTFAYRFESDTELDWRLHGVDIDVVKLGVF